jgi:hypothetical protein
VIPSGPPQYSRAAFALLLQRAENRILFQINKANNSPDNHITNKSKFIAADLCAITLGLCLI